MRRRRFVFDKQTIMTTKVSICVALSRFLKFQMRIFLFGKIYTSKIKIYIFAKAL